MASNKRIFIAFAVEDKFARDNLVYQAKRQRTAPFDFTDLSVKEPWDEKWKTNCRTHLTRHFLFGLSSRRDCTPGFLLSGQSRVVFHPGSSPVVSARPDCRSPRASTPKLPLLEAISSTSLPPLPLLDRFLCCYRFGYPRIRLRAWRYLPETGFHRIWVGLGYKSCHLRGPLQTENSIRVHQIEAFISRRIQPVPQRAIPSMRDGCVTTANSTLRLEP
jgi:hypothetical protein